MRTTNIYTYIYIFIWECKRQRCHIEWSQANGAKKLSFLMKAVYDVLPIPVNLHIWLLTTSDWCKACEKTASLKQILIRCEYALRSYTRKNYEFLEIFAEASKIICEIVNKALDNITNRAIHFVKEGNILNFLRKNRYSCLMAERTGTLQPIQNIISYFQLNALTTQNSDIVVRSVE